MTQQEIQQNQANALGITADQYQKLIDATSSPVGGISGNMVQTQNYGGTGYANLTPAAGQTSDFQQIATMLGALKKAGINLGGQQQQGGPQAPQDTSYPLYATDPQGRLTGAPAGYANAADQMGMLGAAALQMPYVKNQAPGTDLSKGGVAPVGGALIGSYAPSLPGQPVSWSQLAGANNLSQADVTELQKTGLAPADVAHKFGLNLTVPQSSTQLGGPWTQTPGVFTQAPRLAPSAGLTGGSGITPTIPANAAGMAGAQPTPWATASAPPALTLNAGQPPPAAPGVQIPQIPPMVHTSALADAGKALYAHFGGDPNTATHADIADFHRQLTGMVPAAIAHYTAGANTVAAPAAPVRKMQFGGLVPGRGNRDTVPALLTPGEYVIPKQQVLRMQSGGFVPDNQDDKDQPSEARRKRLATATQSQPKSDQATSSSQDQGSSPPAAPGSLYTGPSAAQIRAQNQPAGGSIDSLGRLGDEGLIGSMGIGSGMPTQQATGVAGGLASGLASAAKAYADSIGSWKMQRYDPEKFGSNVAPPAPATQFAQAQLPQPKHNPATLASYSDYFLNTG